MKLELISRNIDPNGDRTPILFVHGAWRGAWCWEEYFLDYFATHGFEAHAVSLAGHGKSYGREFLRRLRIRDYVRNIEETVQKIGRPPILVGHSMGGLVIQKYLENAKAPAAVLMATLPPRGVLYTTLRFARDYPLQFLKVNLTLSLYPLINTPHRAQKILYSDTLPQERINSFFSRLHDESYFAFIDMLLTSLPKPQKVNTPMLVLGAENDRVFHPKEIAMTAKAYGVEPIIFPNMAHDMMLEKDWQNVADCIIGWIGEKAELSRTARMMVKGRFGLPAKENMTKKIPEPACSLAS